MVARDLVAVSQAHLTAKAVWKQNRACATFLRAVISLAVAGSGACSLSPRTREPQSEEPSLQSEDSRERDLLLFSWPVSPPFRLTQRFNRLPSNPHDGIDLGGARNAPVFAAHDGWVSYVGRDFRGYGILVILDSGRGWTTFYSHLNRADVRLRQHLRRGARLGAMGATGNARGVHLHFELRRDKVPRDPLVYLPTLETRL